MTKILAITCNRLNANRALIHGAAPVVASYQLAGFARPDAGCISDSRIPAQTGGGGGGGAPG